MVQRISSAQTMVQILIQAECYIAFSRQELLISFKIFMGSRPEILLALQDQDRLFGGSQIAERRVLSHFLEIV